MRVSSQAIRRAYDESLEVVVDLSLCGARSANLQKNADADRNLLRIYGEELCRGRSAADLAVWQMQQAGVRVVSRYDWSDAVATAAANITSAESSSATDGAIASTICTEQLRVLTWNILAPCYFRDSLGRESSVAGAFEARNARILAALRKTSADLICLQEFWFDERLLALYRRGLPHHQPFMLQRTAFNRDGCSEDGVAILVDTRRFRVLLREDILFQDHGIPQDRVALCVVVQPLSQPLEGVAVALVTTHLTFPHGAHDLRAREAQVRAMLRSARRAVLAWRPQGPEVPLVVTGDLNGGVGDAVARALRDAGLARSFDLVHGRPSGATHVDHRGRHHAADHIWQPAAEEGAATQLVVDEVALLPRTTPDGTPCIRPRLDRAHIEEEEETRPPEEFEEWCKLSDHRPLLATLRFVPSTEAAAKKPHRNSQMRT